MLIKELLSLVEEKDVSSENIDHIFGRLVSKARTKDNFDDDEEKMLKSEIRGFLKKGWTDSEIVGHMRWLEYFDAETDEDEALKNLGDTKDAVKARLKDAK
jgi:ribosomal protein L16 Arg81 hydroxylase